MELQKFNSEEKFSSVFITEQINEFRKVEGNRKILLHKSLLSKIENEFSDEINGKNILPVEYKDLKGEMRKCYELTFDESLQLLMSESKKWCIANDYQIKSVYDANYGEVKSYHKDAFKAVFNVKL